MAFWFVRKRFFSDFRTAVSICIHDLICTANSIRLTTALFSLPCLPPPLMDCNSLPAVTFSVGKRKNSLFVVWSHLKRRPIVHFELFFCFSRSLLPNSTEFNRIQLLSIFTLLWADKAADFQQQNHSSGNTLDHKTSFRSWFTCCRTSFSSLLSPLSPCLFAFCFEFRFENYTTTNALPTSGQLFNFTWFVFILSFWLNIGSSFHRCCSRSVSTLNRHPFCMHWMS